MVLVGFIGSINNGWSRLALAFLAERTSYKLTYIVTVGVQITALLLLLLVKVEWVYAAANMTIFWVTGGHFVNVMVYFNKIYDKQ